MVRVDVSDTGSGIAPDILPDLFQPFVTSKPHGMGVGLSISRTIMEPMADTFGPIRILAAERFFI